ncbi:dihydrokaempferol 4-reductase [Kwoniella heveanensis CBS 569]|nr:dihydrokaempferol 4-reductase [Kwoniella heveanensis CBS 569]
MPAIAPGDLVLVTGASGFISSHTVQAFLERGYNVRGTVRSAEKGEYLKNLFKDEKKGEFEYVIVEDIAQDGAFDEAVKGVNGVAHMASPFHFNAVEPSELFEPAIKGTVGVLESLKKNNPDVKRVVVTSSVASIMDSNVKPPHTFTEKDWNTVSPKECEEQGKDASGQAKYRASKALAERAFWKFFDDNKPSFDGVAINPPLVLGPIIHQCDKPESLNTSVAVFYSWMKGEKTEKDLPAGGMNYVDVRDTALGHVLALTVPEAGGERFITGNGPVSGNDYVLAIAKDFPDLKNVPKGNSDPEFKKKLTAESIVHDGSKATKVLGLKYRSVDDTLRETGQSLRERFNF